MECERTRREHVEPDDFSGSGHIPSPDFELSEEQSAVVLDLERRAKERMSDPDLSSRNVPLNAELGEN